MQFDCEDSKDINVGTTKKTEMGNTYENIEFAGRIFYYDVVYLSGIIV